MRSPTPPPSFKRKRTRDNSETSSAFSPGRSKILKLPLRPTDPPSGGSPRTKMTKCVQDLDLDKTGNLSDSLSDDIPSSSGTIGSPQPQPRPLNSPSPTKDPRNKGSPSSSLALWWSDEDITGHELDPNDPADDGHGINGIGFVPSPQVAAQRAGQRRKQIKEWRERENREARAKRGERRKNKGVDGPFEQGTEPDSDQSERRVRFAVI